MVKQLTEENATLPQQLFRTLWSIKLLSEKELGVNHLATRILYLLNKQDGLTQNFLARFLQVDPSLITRLVKEMEKKHNWVKRERDVQDNRLMRVYLSEIGKEQAQIFPQRAAAIMQRVTANLQATEMTELHRILRLIEDTAKAEYEPGQK